MTQTTPANHRSLRTDFHLSRRPMAAFLVIGLGWGTFAALVPPIKEQIGASDALYGLLIMLASFGAIGAMWLAPLANRVMGRFALIFGCAAVALGFYGAATASGTMMFAAAMFLASVGSGIADVLANAEISAEEARSGRDLMNLNHGMYSVAFACAALGTGFLRDAAWRPDAVTVLLAAAIAVLCLAMRTRDFVLAEEQRADRLAATFDRTIVWIGGLIVLAAFLSEAGTEGWSALHLERGLQAAPSEGAFGPAIFGFAMAFGRLTGHWWARERNDLTVIRWAICLAGLGIAIAALAPTLCVAYLGFGLAGLGISVVVPLSLALIGRSVPKHARVAAISQAAAMGYAAFFLGPSAIGAVADLFGLRISFLMIVAMLGLVALLLVPRLRRAVSDT